MRRKTTFVILVLIIGILIISCTKKESLPSNLTLEQSIKEIITSKGNGYNFLKDQGYMEHMNKLGKELTPNNTSEETHYAIGDLDGDTIPELAVFKQRNPDDVNDEGSLEIYKFNGEKYKIIDKIAMNYDNTNYQIVIGRITENQNGLLLNNQVGAHSGITYGFILKDGKLKEILNEKKLPLISVYTSNEIKDIDNDGILEFSIYIIDPETEDSSSVGSDKITLWYKWDGKDGGTIVDLERKDLSTIPSDKDVFQQAKDLIDSNLFESFNYIFENQDKLSKFDNTELLKGYISKLENMLSDKNTELENLFAKYDKVNNYDYLTKKYGLTLNKFNDIEYLKREKILIDEPELKQYLIDNITLGYKLTSSEGMYYFVIDNQKFIDAFGKKITNEYVDYLKILALDTNLPYLNDGALTISLEKLAERIISLENYKMIYPYSNLLSKVDGLYKNYVLIFLYGDNHDPHFNYETNVMKKEILDQFNEVVNEYNYSYFADIIKEFRGELGKNGNKINDRIRKTMNQRLGL
jgi:hypothetical protein